MTLLGNIGYETEPVCNKTRIDNKDRRLDPVPSPVPSPVLSQVSVLIPKNFRGTPVQSIRTTSVEGLTNTKQYSVNKILQ